MDAPRRIGFLVFPRLTLLDLIGVHDALRRLGPMGIAPGLALRIIGTDPVIADEAGLRVISDEGYGGPPPLGLFVVPSGVRAPPLLPDARPVGDLRRGGGIGGRSRACARARSSSAGRDISPGCAPRRTTGRSICSGRCAARSSPRSAWSTRAASSRPPVSPPLSTSDCIWSGGSGERRRDGGSRRRWSTGRRRIRELARRHPL